MRTCYEMYRRTQTGLAPEIAFFKSTEAIHGFPMVDGTAGGGDFVIKRNVSNSHAHSKYFYLPEDLDEVMLSDAVVLGYLPLLRRCLKDMSGKVEED